MRILLDECVPVQVRNALVGHDVSTAQKMGGEASATASFCNGRNRQVANCSSSQTRISAINKT